MTEKREENLVHCPDCGMRPRITRYHNCLLIECMRCGNATDLYKTVSWAAKEWNGGKLTYRGGKLVGIRKTENE